MLIVISPSKGQDFATKITYPACSYPAMLDDSYQLIKKLRKLTVAEIMSLMTVSKNIATLNHARYREFDPAFNEKNARPSILAFKGDVYRGFELAKYKRSDFDYAQQHLRILSGLYGCLRPLDLIQAYRLEMKTRLANPIGDNLYKFWGDKITDSLNQVLATHDNKYLINLASHEYFKAVKSAKLNGKLLTLNFMEIRDDKAKTIAIYAKRARGLMADYIIRNKIDNIDDIKTFNLADYCYNPQLSTAEKIIFIR